MQKIFLIHRYKSVVMQRIIDYTRHGNHYYASGKVAVDKAKKLVNKFSDHYAIHLNNEQRKYQRKKGLAVSKLILYPEQNADYFLWWMLVSSGEGAVHEMESLTKVSNSSKRLRWDNEYELIQLPHKDKPATWTWRMTKPNYAVWHNQIREVIRQKPFNKTAINRVVYNLSRAPGFYGVREQQKQLFYQINKEWVRTMGRKQAKPELPKRVFYVRRFGDEMYPMAKIIQRIKKGKSPFPAALSR